MSSPTADETIRRAIAALRTGPVVRHSMNAVADLIVTAELERDARERDLVIEVERLKRLMTDIYRLARGGIEKCAE